MRSVGLGDSSVHLRVGARNAGFPACGLWRLSSRLSSNARNWKVPWTRRQECLRYFARVAQQQRHDVEGVACAGATPAASTSAILEWRMQNAEHELHGRHISTFCILNSP